MAGRGGLNLTHSEPLDRFVERYGEARHRLEPLLRAFAPADLRAFSEALGEPTFVGSSGRVFPRSFKASPLLRAWLRRLAGLGVDFLTRTRFVGFERPDGIRLVGPDGVERVERPGAAVLALGGASWPRLGSDGAWVDVLGREGIAVSPLRPSNCGFAVAWSPTFRDRFQGEPLKRLAIGFAGRSVRGEAVVTAEGLEGGAIYALSAEIRNALAAGRPADLVVDLKPGMTEADLAAALAKARRGDSLTNRLRKAAGLPPVAIGLLREGFKNALAAEPAALARQIKAVPIRIVAARPIDRAISTAGGVAFAGLDADLMLAARPGVFVAGEMLDWEAPTGGYLLQGAFATGRAAGEGAVRWIRDRASGAK